MVEEEEELPLVMQPTLEEEMEETQTMLPSTEGEPLTPIQILRPETTPIIIAIQDLPILLRSELILIQLTTLPNLQEVMM